MTKGQVNERAFEKAEVLVRMKCDVHPWMFAYVGVVDHPYFAVTGADGSFKLSGVPAGKSPVEMEYLRWRDDGTPAAGTFDGWPKTLAEFTMLDPCCGSGHFLGAAFNLLVSLRMHDEKLTAEKACEAVLRDNLFGLELDPRCTQIAAFALALAAWKYPDAGGYRPLPSLNIACSGQGVTGKKDEWLVLANGAAFLDAPFVAAFFPATLRDVLTDAAAVAIELSSGK